MSNYTWQYIEKHKKETQRLLGIDYEQLQQLIDYVLILEKRQKEELEKERTRIIKAGGGRKDKLSKENQIILTLIYLRHHLSFQLLGIIFQVSESTANNIFHYWQEMMREALPSSLLEQVKKSEENEEEILEKLTDNELIVDSSEQRIERPSDYQEQKKYYSGKQCTHTFKNQIISLPLGKDIVDVVAGEPGPRADINICRESLNKFKEEQKFSGDKAYIGEKQIKTPKKKPKGGELTQLEKEKNKEISSERIFIEHVIGIIKIFKVTQERFRLNKKKYKSVFLTVCGLVRLRIESLVLKIIKSVDSRDIIDVILGHSFASELHFEENSTKNKDCSHWPC